MFSALKPANEGGYVHYFYAYPIAGIRPRLVSDVLDARPPRQSRTFLIRRAAWVNSALFAARAAIRARRAVLAQTARASAR